MRRPEQATPPGDWFIWLILAGRGWGKTRTGAEFIREEVMAGRMRHVALVAETAADARDVMVLGPSSGILAVHPPEERPVYEPSNRRLLWKNGAIAHTYSAEDPEQLRGPEHDGFWADEPAKWRRGRDTWSNLMMGLRLGKHPRGVATTTPRRVPLIQDLLDQIKSQPGAVVLSGGGTRENIQNLSPIFLSEVVRKYEGTTLGRQELDAILLEDIEGALWTRGLLDMTRVDPGTIPPMTGIVVGVDPPAAGGDDDTAECGIIVAGRGEDQHAYLIDDRSVRGSPGVWGRAVMDAFQDYLADQIVAERNNGGEMVRFVLEAMAREGARVLSDFDLNGAIQTVWASRGKRTRAEPVATLSERGLLHVVGSLPQLEDQLCQWVPLSGMASPDRLDAAVWAVTALMLDEMPAVRGVTAPGFGAGAFDLRAIAAARRRLTYR